MEIVQAWIGRRASERTTKGSDWIRRYIERSNKFCICRCTLYASEQDFWSNGVEGQQRSKGRTFVVLLDGRGRQLSSEMFAGQIGQLRDEGVRRMLIGVGGADGWAKESLTRADLVVSLGPMTLPHELAQLVLAEQIYRALTILAGHPYHLGH